MKKIAIFGANGNIGHQVVGAFRNAGWQVRAVTRHGNYEHGEGVETVAADAMSEAQVIRASEGCDFIFNGVNPPYPQWSEMCMPIAANMMSAAKINGATHLFPGNVYNFGTSIPAFIEDNSPDDGNTKKGNIRISMEDLFARFAQQNDVQTIIVRAGDFFGGSATGSSWFDTVITKSLAKGKITYPGPLDKIHSWAYLPDFAQSFVRLAEQAEEMGKFEVFHFKGHAIDGAQLKNALENVVGHPLKLGSLPWPLLKMAGLFSPMLREISEMSYLWSTPHQMSATRLQNQVGNLQHTDLESALSQALIELDMDLLVGENPAPSIAAGAG